MLVSIENDEAVWRAAISAQKYDIIYLASRGDCRDDLLPILKAGLHVFNKIDAFLNTDFNVIRIINYAVHEYVQDEIMTVDHPGELIPPRAIASIGFNHVAVRQQDFDVKSTQLSMVTEPLWDLHDFAHQVTASLASHLYGSSYFSHLAKLQPSLTALIRSPGLRTSSPKPVFSDGVVFSELLTNLYTTEIQAVQDSQYSHTYASLTEKLADAVADYLLGKRGLCHHTTGIMLSMKQPLTAAQLAVLVQNKSYELPASEMEQRVFTRGGPNGDERDELDGMSAEDRIRCVAYQDTWLYFETRNTIKHRAQKLAYRKVAAKMLIKARLGEERQDEELLERIFDSLDYRGWESGHVVNLWGLVTES
ncbi:hypothetical protein BT63DRAFT_465241 [Microthyrium microscopicum]|uniref:Uncharacterized protein n=1 Tax=Microthyrium microscopicum TaxID=703497 RepID=A0A6A6TX48_9PEZI|nr:hypothetical protein BT63DRAFT_465241 [Microthyrium microscopicum]